ncbi:inositol monophosphatase family protein [Serinicoccus chungangensis]|uniref:inositol monophosphatase family protein n=1 Tax=Serinicoccus chungangensis TaxID=767452 RepID=UPI000AF4E6DB|nr:inositol monophosphatase [Serinicoccus chungangensis]
MTSTLGTDHVLRLLQEVADAVITPRFRSLDEDEISSKTHPGDLVTVADREAEVIITRELSAAYPDAVILGEEAFADDASSMAGFRRAEHAFTVDPVDGTRNFVHGSPDHAVMVAETRGGRTVRAWIWQPQHELAYVAEVGAGATRNGEALPRLEPGTDPARWRVRTSARRRVGEQVGPLAPLELSWVSCGIDYPKLAEGECEGLLYHGTRPWDHVPGALLVSELGGVVGSDEGEAYGPRSEPGRILATAGRGVYDGLRREL